MNFQRHDLVYADFRDSDLSDLGHQGLRELILGGKLPGIVRREEGLEDPLLSNHYTEDEAVYVGFVHPVKEDGQRIRFGTSVDGARIESKLTPYDVARMDYDPRTSSLQALKKLAGMHPVGVWGSNALEIVTGLGYTNETSDLDVLKAYEGHEDSMGLSRSVSELESEFGTRIDVELITTDGFGINLKEYVQGGDTLLAKGLRDVILINREDLEKIHGPY